MFEQDLFSANFTVNRINPNGKQFDNVSRLVCSSDRGDDLVLDINSQIYSLREGESFALVLTNEISPGQGKKAHWHPSELQNSVASRYDYVMCGRVYRYKENSSDHKAKVYISFGGLLMRLKGEQNALKGIPEQTGRDNVYLMIRKK